MICSFLLDRLGSGLRRTLAVLAFAGLFLSSCSSSDHASGTASEGESFVYGYVQDSSLQISALLRTLATGDSSNARVVLMRQAYTDSGFVAIWRDSVWAAADGYFSIAMPDSGIYTLIATTASGAVTVFDGISYQKGGRDLGSLGMYRHATLRGTLSGTPVCPGDVRISLPGSPEYAILNADSTFTLNAVPHGHSSLLAQCGDTVQQWQIFLPGICPEISLVGLSWEPSTNSALDLCEALDSSFVSGHGNGNSIDSALQAELQRAVTMCHTIGNQGGLFNWSWRQGGILTVGADCELDP